jgi:plastocyanin
MSRAAVLPLLAAAALAAFAAGALRAADPAAGAAHPVRLQAGADEFRLTLSRQRVRPGRVRVELVNYGEDPHDLRLKRIGATRVYAIPETAPGERRTRTFRLRAGKYRVWCAVADHRSLGMRATLRVRRG